MAQELIDCTLKGCDLNQNGKCVSMNTVMCKTVPYYFQTIEFQEDRMTDSIHRDTIENKKNEEHND